MTANTTRPPRAAWPNRSVRHPAAPQLTEPQLARPQRAAAHLAPSRPQPPAQDRLPRLLPPEPGTPPTLAAHLSRFGGLPYRGGPQLLIASVEAAGLTGRGGAAFPVHRKLMAVASQRRRPIVFGNGAEGEPASHKDKTLLWNSPHLVLDGLQLAAEAVGADRAALYLHRHLGLHERLTAALAERAAAGLDRVRVELADAPLRFLAGEESSLASKINGGPARPAFKQPRVFERGVAGRPTLVQNVETLAHLALIGRYGAAWFRGLGTEAEPGSMLCSVLQAGGRSGVVELASGAPLAGVLGLGPDVQAVLCGGYHGAWLHPAQAARLPLTNAALRPAGAFVGAGVLIALPAGRCGLAETARVARYLALESANQCGPCFNGLPRIAGALADLAGLAGRPDPRTLTDLERWAGLVTGRGACHHPDGTVRFVRSALTVFRDEISAHAGGRCTATSRGPFLPVPGDAPIDESDWS
jgi:NADH:ubiquinone oxidoreductase subunit F (NADH-binding)